MSIELSKPVRDEAIASIQQYFERNLPEPIGELAAGLLLTSFVEEIGPAVYNQAIADAQSRVMQRVGDLNGELFEDAFTYWAKKEKKRRR